MIQALIIDLDDTLCMTEVACFALENKVLADIGAKPMQREIHIKTWGQPLFEVITQRSPGVDVRAFRKAFAPRIKEATESGELDSIPPVNLDALDKLVEIGKSLVVLTSREHGELKHLLAPRHSLAQRVETFYYRDNMEFHKPDPRVFGHIESMHGWKPHECAYVGDSTSDAEAAIGAGLYFIASLESGLRIKKDFTNYAVDVFVNSFPEVVEAVRDLDKRSLT